MKSKPLFIFILTFIIIAGIVIFLIRPVAVSILSSWKDLAQSKENLKLIDEKKEVLESLKNNDDLAKVADIAEKYIPKQEESGQLILDLSAMAQRNNLQVEQTSLEKTKETSQETTETTTGKTTPTPTTSVTPKATIEAKTVDFTMKLNGGFTDFMNFLKAVETGSRLILLKNISMQQKSESDQTFSFSVQLDGSAYYKSEVSLEQTLDNIKVTEETLKKFLDLKSYAQPINLPVESGFGRNNPFENY